MVGALCAAAAVLLVVSGAAKVRAPRPAVAMLLALFGRPSRDRRRLAPVVRVLGVAEVAVGSGVLVTGSRVAAAALAVAYLSFAVVAALLLQAPGATTSCGCFGSVESPVGPSHLALNLVALVSAVAAVRAPPGRGCGLLDGGAAIAAAGTVQVLVLAALGYLAMTSLPALLAARRVLATGRTSAATPAPARPEAHR